MRPRLLLLGGQTIALGLAMAFLVVPASSVFLATYGAQALPYVYLCVAAAGVVVSALMARAQRRWSLAHVTSVVLASYCLLVGAAWAALSLADASWVTFPLVVLFPLAIPVGFVLIGTQAGRLLDVRQMKSHFPRVVAGFSVGFAIGGLAAARLVAPLGGPANLLGLGVAAGLLMLGLSVLTARRYPTELATHPPQRQARRLGDGAAPSVSARTLFRNRMVVLIFGYQLLSAAVTQLLDYLVWERAAARYPDPTDLARFLGAFGAVINVVSVAFVVLVAGRLLTRYGIRLGLAANPAGVLLLLVTGAVVGYAAGPASTAFFVLVCAQQVTDIALTDGTTRTSINATYQALPLSQRVAAQTWVEGVGFPLALGFVGVLLLVTNALRVSVVSVVVITAVLTALWLTLGLFAYSEYGANLRRTLTRRAWDPISLRLDDGSRDAVERMISGDDLGGVRLGLDVLADTDDPALAAHVRALLTDPDPARRLVAVSASGHATRTAVDCSWVAAALAPMTDDPDDDVRTAAQIALAAASGDRERSAAARLWAAALLGDDPPRRRSALLAATTVPDPSYSGPLVALAESSIPPVGLADALAANADSLAPTTDAALRGDSVLAWRATRRLIGALGESSSPLARATLLAHVDHGNPQVADAVLEALVAGGPAPAEARPALRRSLRREAERTSRLLEALAALDALPAVAHVVRGLRDEVTRSRDRAAGLLGLLHDPTAVARTAHMLAADGGNRPLALETLEVTVGRGAYPQALALLDPDLDDATRRGLLPRTAGAPPTATPVDVLNQLVVDPQKYWNDPWLRACALHALAFVDAADAQTAAPALAGDRDPCVAETALWVIGARADLRDTAEAPTTRATAEPRKQGSLETSDNDVSRLHKVRPKGFEPPTF